MVQGMRNTPITTESVCLTCNWCVVFLYLCIGQCKYSQLTSTGCLTIVEDILIPDVHTYVSKLQRD